MKKAFGRGIFGFLKPKRVNIKLVETGIYGFYLRDYRMYKAMYDAGADFTFIYDIIYPGFVPEPIKFKVKR